MENNQNNEQPVVEQPAVAQEVVTANDYNLVLVMWILIFFIGIISPLIFFFLKGSSSKYVLEESKKCLNTGITVNVLLIVCSLLGFLVVPPIFAFIFAIVILIKGLAASIKHQPFTEKWVIKILK
jgi:uncharacterized Tic20 family protein